MLLRRKGSESIAQRRRVEQINKVLLDSSLFNGEAALWELASHSALHYKRAGRPYLQGWSRGLPCQCHDVWLHTDQCEGGNLSIDYMVIVFPKTQLSVWFRRF
jgi:hypothetical protein